MDLGLTGKVIVVSGGASGVGASVTRLCLDEGARVAILSRGTPGTARFLAGCGEAESQGRLLFVELELGDAAACGRAIAGVLERWGAMDALVNNAGMNDGISLAEGTPEQFHESLRHNLLHYYALAHFALPALKAARGSIVNVGSKVAVTGQGGTSAYAAAKGAQLALTREWAVELLPFGVRVNAVVPAEVETPAYTEWLDTFPSPETKRNEITRRIPLGHRMTSPDEIAAAIVFLLSPLHSGHTTGQQVFVDGGYTHLDRALT